MSAKHKSLGQRLRNAKKRRLKNCWKLVTRAEFKNARREWQRLGLIIEAIRAEQRSNSESYERFCVESASRQRTRTIPDGHFADPYTGEIHHNSEGVSLGQMQQTINDILKDK
jgi:hypothetical protein